MCSIVGSFSVDVFKDLLVLNRSRGSFSHSLTILDIYNNITTTHKGFGEFDLSLLDNIPDGAYLLGHCQAPTNGLVKLVERIHPYEWCGYKLLHNGIIKTKGLKYLNDQMRTNYEWDTQALAEYIITSDQAEIAAERLADIEGSFACALVNQRGRLLVFRNAIAPLFTDGFGNLSSTKFDNSTSLDPNVFYDLFYLIQEFIPVGEFPNTHNPYYF